SKGPVVAYLIRASCEVFGERMWAVRLPAVLCGSLTLLGLYVLTLRVYERPHLALGMVGIGLTLPVLAVGSLLMTIDAPYVCCWTWALVLAHRALGEESGKMLWTLLGLVIGVGTLSKYTMIVFLPLLGFFLLTSSLHRRKLLSLSFWLM